MTQLEMNTKNEKMIREALANGLSVVVDGRNVTLHNGSLVVQINTGRGRAYAYLTLDDHKVITINH